MAFGKQRILQLLSFQLINVARFLRVSFFVEILLKIFFSTGNTSSVRLLFCTGIAMANVNRGIPKSAAEFETAPFDARFPNQNQTRYCWQSFVDFHRCQKVKGDKYEPCNYFQKVYKSICPHAWVENWNEQLDQGTFPGRI